MNFIFGILYKIDKFLCAPGSAYKRYVAEKQWEELLSMPKNKERFEQMGINLAEIKKTLRDAGYKPKEER